MPVHPTKEQIEAVLDACKTRPAGVARTAKYLRSKNIETSYNITYKIMKENKLVTPSAAKSCRRKWIRFEGSYILLGRDPVRVTIFMI